MSIEGRYYGGEADTYDAKRRTTRTRAAEDAAFAQLFRQAQDKARLRSALDLPCGTGRWIESVQKAGIDYTGVDISTDMLTHARREAERVGAEKVTLAEASCFDFLPQHVGEFDIVVCTRFINWWDQETGLRILKLLCGASRKFVLLHTRVDDNAFQRMMSLGLRYPNRVRKAVSDADHMRNELRRVGRLFSQEANGLPAKPHPYISYHNRAAMLSTLAQAGCRLSEAIVMKKYLYGSVEFWLIEKGPA